MFGDACSQIVFSKCHVISAPPPLSLLRRRERKKEHYVLTRRGRRKKEKKSEARCKQMGCVGSGHNM
jgi:hypothetical protein